MNRSGYNGDADSWFTNLVIDKTAGTVTLASFIRVAKNFTVSLATTVPHPAFTSHVLDVNDGAVVTAAGSSLSGLNAIHLGNNTAFPSIGGTAPPVLRIYGAITET